MAKISLIYLYSVGPNSGFAKSFCKSYTLKSSLGLIKLSNIYLD